MTLLYLSQDTLDEISYDSHDHYALLELFITGKARWSTNHSMVFQDKKTMETWIVDYRLPATEYQVEPNPWNAAPNGKVTCYPAKQEMVKKWVRG